MFADEAENVGIKKDCAFVPPPILAGSLLAERSIGVIRPHRQGLRAENEIALPADGSAMFLHNLIVPLRWD